MHFHPELEWNETNSDVDIFKHMNLGVAIENDKGKKYTQMQVPLRIRTLYLFTRISFKRVNFLHQYFAVQQLVT